jgi:hypothetical protein
LVLEGSVFFSFNMQARKGKLPFAQETHT